MAAAMSLSRPSHSQTRSHSRSASNPFRDPAAHPPPPPPKTGSTPNYYNSRSAAQNRTMSTDAALRDTVTLRSTAADHAPRTRMNRSQTTVPNPTPVSGSRPSQSSRRSHSQDSVARAIATVDKNKSSNGRAKSKKGSMHADVIDRLDFSGVGPMFHHDGPFDAVAPSRNRHRTRAPMLAWSGTPDEDQRAFEAHARPPPGAIADTYAPALGYDSPYPQPGTYRNPTSSFDAGAAYSAPKKKVDAIAEAWGIHEPEPYEEFFAGGGARNDESRPNSVYNGKDGRGRTRNRPANGRKRSAIPPPQPVFTDDGHDYVYSTDPPSPSSAPGQGQGTGGGLNLPQRSRSLMHRIKKMRETPNVPVGYQEFASGEPSPTSSAENGVSPVTPGAAPQRPTHRSQNSFLGRFGRARADTAPLEDIKGSSASDEAYVYVDDPDLPALPREGEGGMKDKSLPAPPYGGRVPHRTFSGDEQEGYFSEMGAGSGGAAGGSLGRKTSLMKKMKGVVRPGK